MYVKIHSAKKDNNQGSCQDLVTYLDKENEQKDVLAKQLFFSQDSSVVSPYTVVDSIDKNKSKLTKGESKFYMLTVNPSSDELKHICKKITGRDVKDISQLTPGQMKQYENSLKDYSREVMNEYAKNFNRGLTGKDLLYFGAVEHNRHYERDSKEVREGLHKAGDKKEGLQSHVHIIVSRKDITNKIKLSPMANAKNSKIPLAGKKNQVGFDRISFVTNCEKTFDSSFAYNRPQHLTFDHYHTMKREMRNVALKVARDVPFVQEYQKAARVISVTNRITNAKDPLEALRTLFSQNPGARSCMKAISYCYNPSKIFLDLGRKAASTVIKATGM